MLCLYVCIKKEQGEAELGLINYYDLARHYFANVVQPICR